MRLVYLFLAFINGTIIMALEISSARLLAPYFGASIFVWTNIIGVVMGALALGYFVGGKLSELNPSLTKLLRLMAVTGLLILTIPWLIHPLAGSLISGGVFSSTNTIIGAGSLVAIIALFGLPLMLLGVTSPYLIKLSTNSTSHVGDIAGKLFAVSTIGSLIGTFLPTLILIPVIGTRYTILGCGVVLALIGLTGFNKWVHKLFVICFGILLLLTTGNTVIPMGTIHATESAYQQIKVVEGADQTRYLQFDAGFGIQSAYHPNKILTGHYYDYYTILPLLTNADTNRVLIIGLAGGTIARQLNHYYGDSVTIDGVEIDPAVTAVSKKYLGLAEVPVNIFHQDGRTFLAQSSQTYDIIIVDAYHNEFEIPWTLTTKEFWHETKQHLRPGGIVVMNIATSTTKRDLLDAFIKTGSDAYTHTYVTPTGNELLPISNFMVLLANDRPNFWGDKFTLVHDDLLEIAKHVQNKTLRAYPLNDALLLTDDKAPIDLLTARTLWPELRSRVQ
jgi:spermidine synthase